LAERGDLIVETNEKATTVVVKEFSHDGVKLQYNGQGQTQGKYSGGHIETVDIHQKNDGTFDFEAKGIDSTQDGELVMYSGKGKGRQTGPGMANFEGEVKFMTQSSKLGWLNSTKARVEGTTNQMTNEASFKVYQMK